MITYYDFTPSTQQNFEFQLTLDGRQYNAIITWSLSGKRFYLNLYALDGTLIVAMPVIGSDTGKTIQSAVWVNGYVILETDKPHGYILGATVNLTVSGLAPDVLNGRIQALITKRTEIQYPLTFDPGLVTKLGQVVYNVNMLGSYFKDSTLVYRTANRQFEVEP